jgi:uncharacterized protein YggE
MNRTFIILLAAGLLSGCASVGNLSTVSVVGLGTVPVQPDTLQVSVSLSKVEQTTRGAQEEVNAMVAEVLAILAEERVDGKDTSTSSLRFSQEYEWDGRKQVLVGQKVEQSISFLINDIKGDADKAPRLLDKLTRVDGIALNQIAFMVKDNREHYIASRELAYGKALEKARQYAGLAGLTVDKALSVSEFDGSAPAPMPRKAVQNMAMAEAAVADNAGGGSTILPAGELEITTQLSVVFLLK